MCIECYNVLIVCTVDLFDKLPMTKTSIINNAIRTYITVTVTAVQPLESSHFVY